MSLYEQIYKVIDQIPYGKVASYGQVAEAAGLRRGAQVVGWALRTLPTESTTPWPRVVGKGGRITIINPKVTKTEQVERLRSEGIEVDQENGWYVVRGDVWHTFPTHEN